MSHGPAASSIANGPGNVNSADVMFAQMMISHHQQAVEMSDIFLVKTGVSPEVRELAEQIKAARQPEIDTMTGWLKAWGSTPMPNMSGMQHGDRGGGMMSAADMDKLKAADGASGQSCF